jgi:hypothetical protein
MTTAEAGVNEKRNRISTIRENFPTPHEKKCFAKGTCPKHPEVKKLMFFGRLQCPKCRL